MVFIPLIDSFRVFVTFFYRFVSRKEAVDHNGIELDAK